MQGQILKSTSHLLLLSVVLVTVSIVILLTEIGAAYASSDHDQNAPGYIDISGYGGWFRFSGDDPLRDGLIVGGSLGYMLTQRFAIEGAFSTIFTDFEEAIDVSDEADIVTYLYHADGLYHFMEGDLQPYVVAGVGGITFDSDFEQSTDPAMNFGGGVKFFFHERWAVRVDAREYIRFGEDETIGSFALQAGFLVRFGGPRSTRNIGQKRSSNVNLEHGEISEDSPRVFIPTATKSNVDTDVDGVIDYYDRCPDTPLGATVDESGCPSDSDFDGVLDGLDQCPDTTPGATVDEFGCEITD